MDEVLIYLIPIFFVASLIFAMIGQGGASAYLAVMALFGISHRSLPAIALSCNIVVTLGVIYHFYKAGHLRLRLVLPFVITSIPSAFIAGTLEIPRTAFVIILIAVLVIISMRLFFWRAAEDEIKSPSTRMVWIACPIIGIVLGFLAGIIGIGGGILLLPIIILFKWGRVKQAAVAGGMFTLVNSISGLVGHSAKGAINWQLLIPLAIAALIASQIGARLGARRLPARLIQRTFAVLLFIVAIRLVWTVI